MKKQILFNKARNERWDQDTICMTIIARFGTGGGNIPLILEIDEDELNSLGRAEQTDIHD